MNTEVLEKLYYDPKNPGSFSGIQGFKRTLKDKISNKDLKKWFMDQDTYTLHKPLKKKFTRNRIVVYGIDNTWQADLIDLRDLSSINSGFNYLLTVIDVFSKFAWAIPLKNKTNKTIIEAFKKIFSSKRIPNRIHTDKGSEFIGKVCQQYLKKNKVHFYILNSEMKASIIERFNRTLKEKMWRYFTKLRKKKYIDVIDDLVYSYNHSYHRSIKMRPIDVNKQNEDKVFLNLYGIKSLDIVAPKFKVGDKVRISKNKYLFDKGYTPNWTQELFIISEVIIRDIPVYKIKDLANEEIKGVFYEPELQKVTKTDEVFLVEEILKKRKTKRGVEVLIKWLGYPDKFNSWVLESDVID